MFDFLKGEKGKELFLGKRWLLIVGAIIGVGLLVLGGHTEAKSTNTSQPIYNTAEDEMVIYQRYL